MSSPGLPTASRTTPRFDPRACVMQVPLHRAPHVCGTDETACLGPTTVAELVSFLDIWPPLQSPCHRTEHNGHQSGLPSAPRLDRLTSKRHLGEAWSRALLWHLPHTVNMHITTTPPFQNCTLGSERPLSAGPGRATRRNSHRQWGSPDEGNGCLNVPKPKALNPNPKAPNLNPKPYTRSSSSTLRCPDLDRSEPSQHTGTQPPCEPSSLRQNPPPQLQLSPEFLDSKSDALAGIFPIDAVQLANLLAKRPRLLLRAPTGIALTMVSLAKTLDTPVYDVAIMLAGAVVVADARAPGCSEFPGPPSEGQGKPFSSRMVGTSLGAHSCHLSKE